MSETRLLSLVLRYPHRTALARRATGSVFGALQCLEIRGLVRQQGDQYRLTRQGQSELAMTRALARLVARTADSLGDFQLPGPPRHPVGCALVACATGARAPVA